MSKIKSQNIRNITIPGTHPAIGTRSLKARFDEAVRQHQSGNTALARESYQQVLAISTDYAPALHMLGVIHLQERNFAAAAEWIAKAITEDANMAVYFNNYGAALHGMERYVDALTSFHRAVAIRPKYADAVSNLGMAYESLGQREQAVKHYRQALELNPQHADARVKYAALVEQWGNPEESLRYYEQSLQQQPTAEMHLRLGNLHLSKGRSPEAIIHYEQAIALEKDCATALFNLGNAYHEQHRVAQAQAMFTRAAEAKPQQPFWKLRVAATCPAVFADTCEIDNYCDSLHHTLDHWIATRPAARGQDLIHAAAYPNFTFAYLGRNVRPLKQKFAELYRPYFEQQSIPTGSGLVHKKRLGIVVTPRHEGIFLRCMQGILQGLSRDLFELVIICSASGQAALRQGLNLPDLKFVTITQQLDKAARTIRETACDVLHFWEVGSDALNYFLPFCRLAPVQSTSHGSQITSGNPAIDYFYSSALLETEFSQEHYAERLWNSGTMLMNQLRLAPPPPTQRGQFGLPEDRTLYMCLQNPLKFRPDFDPLLNDILQQDDRGVVVLLRGSHEYAETQLRARFARTLPHVHERVLFLPYQKFTQYMQLIQLADVMLDPLHFGAGSSAYDIFSLNRPLVTLPTPLNIGRVGAALHAKMGLPELTSLTAEAYVRFAIQLGTNRDYRREVERQITAHSDALFNDQQAVFDHQHFFDKVCVPRGH